jgi:hypothetical protein
MRRVDQQILDIIQVGALVSTGRQPLAVGALAVEVAVALGSVGGHLVCIANIANCNGFRAPFVVGRHLRKKPDLVRTRASFPHDSPTIP